MISFMINGETVLGKDDPVQEAKKGIVEIQSGFNDNKGEFYEVEKSSGFLIYNKENTAYIVTAYDALYSPGEKIEDCRKEHKLDEEDVSSEDVIKVVVTGDVVIDATVFAKSEEENFAIIQTSSAIGEKDVVGLGTTEELITGDTIYTLGYEDSEEVKVVQGFVQDVTATKDGISYIQHSAEVTKESNGGVCIDVTGYAVGVNIEKVSEEGEDVYYSLPIEEVIEVLDNFSVPYESLGKDQLEERYQELLEECQNLTEDKKYKADSRNKLKEILANTTYELQYGEDSSSIQSAIKQLENGKSQLVLKMKLTRKIVYLLLGIIIILAIWLVRLIIWKKKQPVVRENSKKEKDHTYEDQTFFIDHMEKKKPVYQKKAIISRNKTGETVRITKEKFSVGKKEELNDYVIAGNVAISRQHARIVWENGQYYLIDLGSANGTFVDDKKLESGWKEPLKDNCIITLADELFIFRIEN